MRLEAAAAAAAAVNAARQWLTGATSASNTVTSMLSQSLHDILHKAASQVMCVLLQRCRQVWGDKGKVITQAINATDPATALEHNLYTRHPDSLKGGHWGVGRVTLVGDAAHPLRPTGDSTECDLYLVQNVLNMLLNQM